MSSMHTACVVGKNYRLQDIQLSKSTSGKRPQNPRAVARGNLTIPTTSRGALTRVRATSSRNSDPTPCGVACSLASLPETVETLTVGRVGPQTPPRGQATLNGSPPKQCGEYRARTGDLLVANQALSQLS